jgi:hypothetical protein
MLGDDPDHDPAQVGELCQPVDVFDELPSVRAVLVAVVLQRDHVVLPAQVQHTCLSPAVVNRYLRSWFRQTGVDK